MPVFDLWYTHSNSCLQKCGKWNTHNLIKPYNIVYTLNGKKICYDQLEINLLKYLMKSDELFQIIKQNIVHNPNLEFTLSFLNRDFTTTSTRNISLSLKKQTLNDRGLGYHLIVAFCVQSEAPSVIVSFPRGSYVFFTTFLKILRRFWRIW